MTNMTNHKENTNANAMDELKTELVKETLQILLTRKDHQFDLSTEERIHDAVNYTLNALLQQKIQNGEIKVIEQSNSSGVMQ
ncbi:hypothetical protein [Acinetobacter gerneri]|uniref:hypothetical protein n=1 Tax=Acinetobacter gerneri TaxID=202952 RepID=UPI003A8501FD